MSVAEPVSSAAVARGWWARQFPWRYRRHALDGGVAVADQALVSGANFLASVLLARWLAPAEYGLYALMLSLVYAFASVQQALVIQPMRVFGATVYKERQRDYYGNLILGSASLGLAVALMFGAGGLGWLWLGGGETARALAAAGVAVLGVMLFWLGRDANYVATGPKSAAACDAFYVAILLSGLWALRVSERISITAVLVLIGGCSLAAAALLLGRLRPRFSRTGGAQFGEQWRRHWGFGKWELTSTAIGSLNLVGVYGASGFLLGMKEAGALRALLNLMLPAQQFVTAINRLAVPRLSEVFAGRGARAARLAVWKLSAGLAALSLLAWVFTVVFRHEIFRFLYGEAYQGYADYLPPLILAMVALLVAGMFEAGLRAVRAPGAIAFRHTVTTVICIGASFAGTALFGFPGIVGAVSVFFVSVLAVTAYLFQRRTAEPQVSGRRAA